jgi:hypothetical protein
MQVGVEVLICIIVLPRNRPQMLQLKYLPFHLRRYITCASDTAVLSCLPQDILTVKSAYLIIGLMDLSDYFGPASVVLNETFSFFTVLAGKYWDTVSKQATANSFLIHYSAVLLPSYTMKPVLLTPLLNKS